MSYADIEIEYSLWRARLWVHVCRLVSPIAGRERAHRWASRGAHRLLRWRLAGDKRWSRIDG